MLHISHLAILAATVLAWGIQFVLAVVGLSRHFEHYFDWPWILRAALAMDLLVGIALGVLIVRALYWHPRSRAQVVAAVRKERQRIARELHDQVGSQLVNAMMLFESPDKKSDPVMQTLEQCMLDLRLLVDVMSDGKGNLAEKLGTLRHRVQPVLEKRGITLTWAIESEPTELLPRGSRARELCRLVQEAVSNELQHSKASHLIIELCPHSAGGQREWILRVMDNGVGMQRTARIGYVGRGLAHMKRRALRAGGMLEIRSDDEVGTEIVVIVTAREQGKTSRMPL
ncbi:sensor histidine kinase [Diaphorobacter caeni]|uniref:sensor histidine kinase n=1 Tax=Diaphorobacter caeni TaxID=2784387 RepID=UPI00188F30A6|nr:ATP-binding protein [Diaphorobacter caeni]MBF5004233.1 ATP-binding protein [Diaphorobacter caeni]